MSIQTRHWFQAVIFITLICILVSIFVISTQTTDQLTFGDTPWYLNRAHLIWQGVLPDLFVYTLAFPAFIGLIDLVVHDPVLSAILASGLLLWLILLGTYLMGRWLYGSQRIAWLAVLLTAISASMLGTLRIFSPFAAFTAAMIWCIVAFLFVLRHPGYVSAALLGIALALALYTRFEGVAYTFAIPLAAWIVARRGNRRQARQVFLTAGVMLAILALPFVVNFAQVRQSLDSGLSANVTGIFSLLNRTPIEWDVIWRRVTDSITGLLFHWTALAWIVVFAGVIWASPRHRAAQWFCIGLVGYNVLYSFLLDIWPSPGYFGFSLPFIALIIAATLEQMIRRGAYWKFAVLPLFALLILPGLLTFAQLSVESPPFAYRSSDLARTGAALDAWIQSQGLAQAHIYTFCGAITPFSRADFQIIYRLQFTTGWDVPDRLIPQMRRDNALLMTCGSAVPYPNWRALLQQASPPGFHEVGHFDPYIFYRPDPR